MSEKNKQDNYLAKTVAKYVGLTAVAAGAIAYFGIVAPLRDENANLQNKNHKIEQSTNDVNYQRRIHQLEGRISELEGKTSQTNKVVSLNNAVDCLNNLLTQPKKDVVDYDCLNNLLAQNPKKDLTAYQEGRLASDTVDDYLNNMVKNSTSKFLIKQLKEMGCKSIPAQTEFESRTIWMWMTPYGANKDCTFEFSQLTEGSAFKDLFISIPEKRAEAYVRANIRK